MVDIDIVEILRRTIQKDKQLSDKLQFELEKEQTGEERQEAIMHLLCSSPECFRVVFGWFLFTQKIE